jgi:hypothetical protein
MGSGHPYEFGGLDPSVLARWIFDAIDPNVNRNKQHSLQPAQFVAAEPSAWLAKPVLAKHSLGADEIVWQFPLWVV